MLRYVLKRTLMVIPILLAVVLIVFTIMELTPGTPGRVLLGELAAQEEVDQLDHKLGTDQPFFYRYFQYIKDIVLRFDFGVSYRTQKPVVKEILNRFPYTLKITFLAVLGSSVIGIPIGVLMAAKRNMLIDRTVNILAIFFTAVPGFVLALGLIYVFAGTLGVVSQLWDQIMEALCFTHDDPADSIGGKPDALGSNHHDGSYLPRIHHDGSQQGNTGKQGNFCTCFKKFPDPLDYIHSYKFFRDAWRSNHSGKCIWISGIRLLYCNRYQHEGHTDSIGIDHLSGRDFLLDFSGFGYYLCNRRPAYQRKLLEDSKMRAIDGC